MAHARLTNPHSALGLAELRPTARAALVIALALSACATQREQRVSSADARERPTDETCEPKGKPPAPGSVWACGYWHWDGVRYVWVDGQWRAP